ncbi:hypothetical protein FEM48_Zijuj04G0120600 [Ziziphus jujuba var. spinosa]|uniref:Uncharacterized protein n=1 Tax=Ziziphus jujuba var. spinosa TaxID=714518 RepID=A0A978VJS2_ZIZJJ|nr:hypothetical protein FEM48_Zijuj04G0120600 [Ziziphus jujuba var. spinosa]
MIKSACQNIVSDELKKLDSPLNDSLKMSTFDSDINDILWEYDEPDNIETWQDEEDEYLAYAVYVHVQVNNKQVALPSLEVLDLGGLQFKRIWADQLPQTCQNLRELSVYWCNSLKYLLSFAIARYLVQLEKLIVEECDDMGKIIIIKKPTVTLDNSDDQLDIIEFPELKIIHLRYLPQIIQFCSQSCEGQGSDYEQVAFPSLEQLFLWNLKSVKRIWPNQLPETFYISDCPKLFSRTAKEEEDKHMDLQEKISMRSPCADKKGKLN